MWFVLANDSRYNHYLSLSQLIRFFLFIHQNNPTLSLDNETDADTDDTDNDNTLSQCKSIAETRETPSPVVRYEDKYLDKFNTMMNSEYIWTPDELVAEKQKIDELTHKYQLEYDTEHKKLTTYLDRLHLIETSSDTIGLIKRYADLEEDENDNAPDNILENLYEHRIGTFKTNLNTDIETTRKQIEQLVAAKPTHEDIRREAREFIVCQKLDSLKNSYISENTPLRS
jgi:hypothetical protein